MRAPLRAGLVFAALALMLAPVEARATWSVIAVDRATGRVIIASATCVSQAALERFPALGLWEIQAIVVPGVGVAAAQAGVDRTRENQRLIHRELTRGTPPERILELLREDPQIERRQFAILDMEGRSALFTGSGNGDAALAAQGAVPGTAIRFAVQGNILASDAVVEDAVEAFLTSEGTMADRVMAAMEAADAAGGDRRCSCESQPVPDAPCTHRTSHVAYLLVAEADDPPGESFNDGEWSLFIDVTDQNITHDEDANPVATLRMRYDAWREGRGG